MKTQRTSKTLISSLLALALFGASCAPAPQSVRYDSPLTPTGPNTEDVELDLSHLKNLRFRIGYKGEIQSAHVFRLVENLQALNYGVAPTLKDDWIKSFWSSLPTERTSILNSEYPSFLAREAGPVVKAKLNQLIPELKSAPKTVRRILRNVPPANKKGKSLDLDTAVKAAIEFVTRFEGALSRSTQLSPQVSNSIRHAIGSRKVKIQKNASTLIQELQETVSLSWSLQAIERFLAAEGITLPEKAKLKFSLAKDLAQKVDDFTTAQGALTVLIEVWTFLSPQEREQVFKEVNIDLYEYLSKQSDKGLECLKSPSCPDFSKFLAKKLKIEPELNNYGLGKIRAQINHKGAIQVRAEVHQTVLEQLQILPETLAELIEVEINKNVAVIEKWKKSFDAQLVERFQTFSSTTLEADGPALLNVQPARATLNIKNDGLISLEWVPSKTFSPESQGALTALSPVFLSSKGVSTSQRRGLALGEAMNAVAIYSHDEALNKEDARDLTARGFAESIRGLSQLAQAFADWKEVPFDNLIGKHIAQDLFPEIKSRELQRSIFPKDAFLAVTYANIASILETMTKPGSPIFVVNTQKEVKWADQIAEGDPATPAMAGIVDRINGERSTVVNSQDVSRLILALCEFIAATQFIETTKSEILLTPRANGKTPRDEIIDGRNRIKLLVLGLANYISHQFRPNGRLVQSQIEVATQTISQAPVNLLDQVLAIRALLASATLLGTEIYRWEAVSILYAMNETMYRKNLGFYAGPDEKHLSPFTLVESLRAFEEIKPFLSIRSSAQISKISQPWLKQVTRWRFQ